AQQHQFHQMLPGAAVLLVGRLNRPDVVARAAGDRVPAAAALGGFREGPLGQYLAHRIALAAIGATLGVALVRIAVLEEHRPAHQLLDVGFGHHRGHAGGDHDPGDRTGVLDAGDQVIADALHVVLILVGADVRDVG